MKQNKLFLIAMVCLLSVTGYAQTTDTFRQPYPLGKKLSPNPNFTGEVWLAPLSEQKKLNVPMSNVTFEPGCRNSWHLHKAGQMLIATAGVGYYQEKGKPARRLFPGRYCGNRTGCCALARSCAGQLVCPCCYYL